MYKRILLAYDGSEMGRQALLECKDLAQWSHADLCLVAVMPSIQSLMAIESSMFTPIYTPQDIAQFQSTLEEGLQLLTEAGFKAHGELLKGDIVYALTNHALKIQADLIVVGHKHLDSWAARWWRGSTSGDIIEHAPCSVLYVIGK